MIPPTAMPTVDEAPSNYKKDAAKENWVTREWAKRQADRVDKVARMGLDIDLAKIRAIGWSITTTTHTWTYCIPVPVNDPPNFDVERNALEVFWDTLEHHGLGAGRRIVGYNIGGFDLPILKRRAFMLNVPIPLVRYNPYRMDEVVDLMDAMYPRGGSPGIKRRGLKAVCEMLYIRNDAEGVSGADVAQMDDEQVVRYCVSDVRMTTTLAEQTWQWYWR